MEGGAIKMEQLTSKQYFRFQKVEDYFKTVSEWDSIQKMTGYEWKKEEQTLILHLQSNKFSEENQVCDMLIQPVTGSIFRVRFHPEKMANSYADNNTRTIVQDNFSELVKLRATSEFDIKIYEEQGKFVELSFHGSLQNQWTVIKVTYNPFTIEVQKRITAPILEEYTVLKTSENGLRFCSAGGFDDYHIVQTVQKPYTAKYVGFGEQGGLELVKNNTCVTYFNYDNMRYRQVYNKGPLEEREPLYHSDPFFMEVNGRPECDSAYGIFIDNPSETLLDMGYYKSSRYQFGIRYGVLDYYVIVGNTCGDIIKSFSNIVGTARLIPRYALGYHQGCYGYEKRSDLHEVVNRYREYQIPLDGLHVDVDLQRKYQTFTIDENKFQNPKEMFEQLRNQGVKCSTNITPIISNKNTENYTTYKEGIEKEYFVIDERFDPDNPEGRIYYKYASGKEYEYPFNDKEQNYNSKRPFIGEVYYGNDASGVELGSTGHYPDLNRKEVRKWWGEQYKYLFEQGLEMIWQDMTTPCLRDTRGDMLSFPSRLLVNNDYIKASDDLYSKVPVMRVWNLYSYNLHKATYHGLNHLASRKNKRNFIIGRGCYTGMQRFAALWTGDNSSNWDFLKINISQILALGLTGQALSGQDIGGFERENDWEQWADPELLIRWTAMGAFLPWFRNHYIRKGKKRFQEPYAYQDVINEVEEQYRPMYRSVLPVCKYYIELRYTLLQLFYDAMFENTLNGMPICRPLFITDPKDKALFNDRASFLNNEFMVRNDLLVAPVLERETEENGYGKRDVYLPSGSNWYQFMNGKYPLNKAIEGGTNVSEFDAHISEEQYHIPFIVPVYVREGAIIPTIELEQYVGECNQNGQPNPITLNIYPGQSGEYTMYLDDGVSRSSQPEILKELGIDVEANGEYRETQIRHNYITDAVRQITIERVHNGYTPVYEDYMFVALLHAPEEQPICEVTINKMEVVQMNNREDCLSCVENAWYYDANTHTSFIKVMDTEEKIELNVR